MSLRFITKVLAIREWFYCIIRIGFTLSAVFYTDEADCPDESWRSVGGYSDETVPEIVGTVLQIAGVIFLIAEIIFSIVGMIPTIDRWRFSDC